MAFDSSPFSRISAGTFRVRLSAEERELLRGLAGALGAELAEAGEDPALARLFPPGYDADDEAEREYRNLMDETLRDQRSRELGILADTADRDELTEEELHAWLTALNDLRLVLGTRLAVTEDLYERTLDLSAPGAESLATFFYLTWLQEAIVDAAPINPTR
jgi:hypothetical protein